MLTYYRAGFATGLDEPLAGRRTIDVPTLVIGGSGTAIWYQAHGRVSALGPPRPSVSPLSRNGLRAGPWPLEMLGQCVPHGRLRRHRPALSPSGGEESLVQPLL